MPIKVRQISIFLENRVGRLMEATKAIGREQVNIRAISVVEVSDFGIVRLVVDDTDAALVAFQRIGDRKSTRLNSSHIQKSRMPSSA